LDILEGLPISSFFFSAENSLRCWPGIVSLRAYWIRAIASWCHPPHGAIRWERWEFDWGQQAIWFLSGQQ